jgi:hypothetical protein
MVQNDKLKVRMVVEVGFERDCFFLMMPMAEQPAKGNWARNKSDG